MPEDRTASPGIVWAGLVNLAGGVTGAVVGLLLAALVGRGLGTQGAGTYFLVVAAFMIVSNVVELGADTGLVRFVSAARARGLDDRTRLLARAALWPVAVAGVLAVGVTAVVVGSIPDLVEDPLTGGFVIIAAAIAMLSSLVAVVLGAVRGLGDVVTYPLLQNVCLPVLRLIGVAIALLAGWGVIGVLGAWLAPVAVVLTLATAVARRLMACDAATPRFGSVGTVDRRDLTREFWWFSAARGVAATVEILLEWADVILVGAIASPAHAGIYAVVTRCARAGEVLQQAARIAVGPQISAALARGAPHEVQEIYGLVTAAMIWLAWPFLVVLAVFGDAILTIFGSGFSDGAACLVILSATMGVSIAAGTVQTILLMGGRSSWQLADKSLALCLNVVLDLMLIPIWGIEGAAVAWAVTILVDTAVAGWQVQCLMGLRPSGGHLWTAATMALAVVGGPALLARLVLGPSTKTMLVTTAVLAAVYLAMSWPLRRRLGLAQLTAHRNSD